MEVLIVMAVIGILVTIIMPSYKHSVLRAREAVLKENLFQIRDAINKYYRDKSKYPTSLDDLVTYKYLRQVPSDPITKGQDWQLIHFEPEDQEDFDPEIAEGIIDVKSNAQGIASDGSGYSDW